MKIVLVFVFAFCFIQQGYAATKTWDGGAGTDNWTHAANWDSDVAPIGGDALVFDGSAQPTPNNDFPNATSFASITFAATASTFTLSGNSVIITGGATAITTNAASLTMTIGNNITFSTAAPTITIVSLGTLAISGTIVNGGLLITTTCDGTLTLSGVISGVGGFTKNGAGTCTLSETNTMSGTTTISAGTLEFGGNGNVAGAIVNNSALAFNQTGSITNSSLISGTGTITSTSFNLALTGNNTFTGVFTINSDRVNIANANALGSTAGGTIINGITSLIFNNTYTYAAEPLTINASGFLRTSSAGVDNIGTYTGNITLGGNTPNFKAFKAGDIETLSGVISGAFNVEFNNGGSGTVVLSGANTYSGTTKLSAGTLSINTIYSVGGGNSAIGAPTTAGNGTIAIGLTTTSAILKYTGTVQTTDRVINLAGTTGGVTLDQSGTGLLTFSSAFTATGAGAKTLTLQGSTAGTGLISGAIVNSSSATSLTKSGTGTWTLSGANTYTGTTTITGGVLELGATNTISSSSNFIANGGTFSTGATTGYSETMGTITLNANTIIALGTGSHSLNFATGTPAWTGSTLLRITGWQGGFDCTSGTSGKVYMGTTTELGAQLSQIFFSHPISGLPYTACQLNTGEIVSTGTLPVKLISFNGELKNNIVELEWITASEINSDYFEILRSSDALHFESIGKIAAAGNSYNFLNYKFVDTAPLQGSSYYKLVQYDFDGANESFHLVPISNHESTFKLNALYPNPSSSFVTVNFQAEAAGSYFLTLSDEQGKEIYSAIVAGIKGENKFDLNLLSFTEAHYILNIYKEGNCVLTAKVIKKN